MILLMGFVVVAASWILAWLASSALGFDFYWAMAGLWAWWAATDARSHDLRRFERVFPLEPMPLFLAVLLLFPIALPWYLHLKHRALSGRLAESARPSRAKWVLVGGAAFVALATLGAAWMVSSSDSFKALRPVVSAIDSVSDDAMSVTIHSSGQMIVRIANSRYPSAEREGKAQVVALAAYKALAETTSVRAIAVEYESISERVGITTRRSQEAFNWSLGALRDAAEYGF